MTKNLPIKLVKKRDDDKRKNDLAVVQQDEIGKRFKLQGAELSSRLNYLRDYFDRLNQRIIQKKQSNNFLPSLVQLKINDEALAKTYRTEIGKVFNVEKKINIIGLVGESQILVKVDNEKSLHAIQQRIGDPKKNLVAISILEEAEDFRPIILDNVDEENDLKIKLINYGDYKLNEIAERSFEKLCEKQGIRFEKLNYAKDLLLYRVSNVKPQNLTNFNESESIYSISKMPLVKLSRISAPENGQIDIKLPEEGVNYLKIGVFDGGISDIEHLEVWKDGSYKPFEEGHYDNAHGTFVAGIINYGDALERRDWTGTRPFKITEAIIYPNDNYGYIDEGMMIDFMRQAIKAHPNVKVWNFSIGNETAVQDSQYSDFAKFLDDLQDEYNVLIVKAAGNCENFLIPAPRGRITEASESLRTLVVGSIAHEKSNSDIAKINCPSPFSMVGPGTSDVIKPDLVHYGGNAGVTEGELIFTGVKSFAPDGSINTAIGTSFSSPRVAALAAELAGSLKEEFNPLMIKGLLIHSAKHPIEFEDSFDDRISQIGFGLPAKINDIIYNDPDEVTLIIMDSVDKGSHIKIMDFPFPDCLINSDGLFTGKVKITLVTKPKIDPYQGGEYIQSDIDLAFGTYEKKIKVGESKIKRNAIDTFNSQNLLLPSLYSSIKTKSATSDFKAERFLRSYSDVFLPIKKWHIDIDELQDAHKKRSLKSDRLWFLKLAASYRNNFDTRMKDVGEASQEFALIITIQDPRKQGKAYNEVNQLLNKYNFLHENLQVNQDVRVF